MKEFSTLKESSALRRRALLEAMNSLEKRNVDCQNCPGTCCTFVGNSMQVTVLEGLDLYIYLVESGLWNSELEDKLNQTIKDFRLDSRPSTGGASLLRKTYTCPFFGHQNLGCPLPREVKPYGCLGFNPREANENSGDSCKSDQSLLLERESESRAHGFEEEEQGLKWQNQLGLFWAKESIPMALIDIHHAYKNLK